MAGPQCVEKTSWPCGDFLNFLLRFCAGRVFLVQVAAQLDFALKGIYDNKLWFGANYRSTGDIGALFGYSINDRYIIGYSYDIQNAELADYSSGSHEFMLAIKLKTTTPKAIK